MALADQRPGSGRYADRHDFTEPVEVTCAACQRTTTMTVKQRNDHRHPGHYCDGSHGARHMLVPMHGPDGKTYR